MKSSRITGVGSHVPDKIVTNDDLAKTVDTSDEWIKTRTGIEQRRVTDDRTSTSDLAIKAAQKAIKMSGIDPKKIDVVVVGTCSPDTLFPSVSCIVQNAVGAVNASALDVSAACSGFNYALSVASNFISLGTYKTALVIGADTLTKYLNWQDRNTCVLFGDGAGAVVLEQTEKGGGILANYLYADGTGKEFLVMPGGGSRNIRPKDETERCISMNGKEVFKFAVKALENSLVNVANLAGVKLEDIDLVIPHQANVRIIDHVVKKLGIPKEKFFVNLQKYGNTSSASIPIALDEAWRGGKIKKGDIIAIIGFGAGLTSGANILKWEV